MKKVICIYEHWRICPGPAIGEEVTVIEACEVVHGKWGYKLAEYPSPLYAWFESWFFVDAELTAEELHGELFEDSLKS